MVKDPLLYESTSDDIRRLFSGTSLETAATLVPGDPESEQLVARTAYASEPSAFAVKKWLLENCGLDIPITTIAPQEAVPAQTTTIAPVDTTEGTNQSDE